MKFEGMAANHNIAGPTSEQSLNALCSVSSGGGEEILSPLGRRQHHKRSANMQRWVGDVIRYLYYPKTYFLNTFPKIDNAKQVI